MHSKDIRSVQDIPADACRRLRGIFFDIDDTFSYKGKILEGAYNALWEARRAGLITVPITGRPAGWADHIARMWPVDGVVGENGGFYFRVDRSTGHMRKRYFIDDQVQREANQKRLWEIYGELKEKVFPRIGVASDQLYRECDIAVDFCEDITPPLTLEDAGTIRDFFHERGAHARVSSIHVNAWFGDYNKQTMCKIFADEQLGICLDEEKERFLFCGDSPNDCPMFAFFPFSAGVASVRRYLEAGLMEHVPPFVASQDGSMGFEEIVHKVLAFKSSD